MPRDPSSTSGPPTRPCSRPTWRPAHHPSRASGSARCSRARPRRTRCSGFRPGRAGHAVGVPAGVRLAHRQQAAAAYDALTCSAPSRRADRGRRAGSPARCRSPPACCSRSPRSSPPPGGGHPAVAAVREPGGRRPRRPPARRPDGRDAPVSGVGVAGRGAGRCWQMAAARRRRCRRGLRPAAALGVLAARCCSSPGGTGVRRGLAAGSRRLPCCSSRSAPRPRSRPGGTGCPRRRPRTAGARRAPGHGWSPRRPPWRRRSPGSSCSASRARTRTGVNLYTSAAPVLVAVPAVIVVMRVYPVVLRGLLHGFAESAGDRVPRPRPGGAGPRLPRRCPRSRWSSRSAWPRSRAWCATRSPAGRSRRPGRPPAPTRRSPRRHSFPDVDRPPGRACGRPPRPGVTHAARSGSRLGVRGRRAAHRPRRGPGELRCACRGHRRYPRFRAGQLAVPRGRARRSP